MKTERTEKKAEQSLLSDKEVLEILQKANSQYEKYVELASFSREEKTGTSNAIRRDINHPLNIILK
jgi:hypothetical protein